jgi:hypothetical protein
MEIRQSEARGCEEADRENHRSWGDPSIDQAPSRSAETPEGTIDVLIETETETVEALYRVIPSNGQEGPSESLEHLLEHIIMRKQNQIDYLYRVRGSS